ncbi:uncharacterized protein N7496_006056 [Penicillium cataractarum]|uniref:F-box domain-containing protein n=1 Tax=Penicillium cataractarum TaxID=2100454 RepID=A0A9W9S3J1_9EURO|nr:uncharacterized protein N7496_006056 [Penicillium cataractarum]KAJ5369964.1 hypothetical protein N7496_006056 [Penicillium cataractarum]
MLEALPYELLFSIAEWLPPQAIRSLSRVSSKLYSTLIPLAYRSVTFRAASEWALNVLDVDSFFNLHQDLQECCHLLHTKNLSFVAPIHVARFNRCTYFNVFRTMGLRQSLSTLGTSNETKAHEQFLDDISRQIKVALAHLKPHNLRSFQWRLGTCIPAGFLDTGGLINRQQNCLTHLVLVTDGSCPHAGGCLEGLHELTFLESLEWEGVQHPAEIDSLRRCVRQNSPHLTNLSIGFAVHVANIDFYRDILGLPAPNLVPLGETLSDPSANYPFLQSLSLSKAPLPLKLRQNYELLFCSLKSLTLHGCANELEFLKCLSHSHNRVRLVRFEFCSDSLLHEVNESRDVNLKPLTDFLLSFQGLRYLHLKLSNFSNESHIQTAIAHHHSTLESLAYHQRQLVSVGEEGLFEETRDYSAGWILQLPKTVDTKQIIALALNAPISFVEQQSKLEPVASVSTLRILHFRFSGSELYHRNIQNEVIVRLSQKQPRCPDCRFQTDIREAHSCSIIESNYATRIMCESHEPDVTSTSSPLCTVADEFIHFAEWAFGPTGLPNLRVLAFGDFSFGSRYENQQCLFRRRPVSKGEGPRADGDGGCRCWAGRYFCIASGTDPLLWNDIKMDEINFLSVCPENSLMESPYE